MLMFFVLFYFVSLNKIADSGVIQLENRNLYKLDIVHYNDFHDRFEETSVGYPVCITNDTKCLGGFARLYHKIRSLMRSSPNALLLNAGDVFQGTYWYTLLKWNNTLRFINMLPHTAHTIGNHEFDDGIAGLAPFLAGLRAPVVVTNIDTSAEPSLQGLYKKHHIVIRRRRRIGIIGLITTDTKLTSNSEGVLFLDPIESARNESNLLTNKYLVDIVILLSHCGLDVDRNIALLAGENIDIIVGGHSHSLLWNGVSPSAENVSGPYPELVESESKPGHKVLIVTASAFTKYLGNLKTYFDDLGDLQHFEGNPIFLNRSVPEDRLIKKLLRPQMLSLHQKVNHVVGLTKRPLDVTLCGTGECAIGNAIADAFIEAMLQKKKQFNLPHVSLILRNMIRGSIGLGEITRGAVINCLPFSNRVVSFSVPGRTIVAALERCMTNYWDLKPFNGPWMPHISGMRVTLNTTNREVTAVEVLNGTRYEPLDLDQMYEITTVSFIAYGGNGFKMFQDYSANATYVGKDNEIFEEYIKEHTPLEVELDNRLRVFN